MPVYVKGTSRTTIADRRRNLAGFVVGMFDLGQLLQSIRTTTSESAAVVLTAYAPERDGATQTMPDYASAPATSREAGDRRPRWACPGARRRWSIEIARRLRISIGP